MSGVLIVGGSVAGIRAARALREQGYDGPVRVLEAEHEVPYDKPPLSKRALGADLHVPLISVEEANELGLALDLGCRVVSVDTDGGRVVLDDGSTVAFGHLVIATGLTPRRVAFDVDGIHVLRTLQDARALRDAMITARRILILGGGFIGAEIASLARGHGLETTMVDPDPVPLTRVVGADLGLRLAELHREHGVDTRFGTTVDDLVKVGSAYRARLSDGTEVLADVVVAGIGSEVNVGWLEDAGIPIDDGVLCDEHGEVLGHPRIHAVGDVARWAGIRVEHWTNAIEQAVCVAHNITHSESRMKHSSTRYVWSDQYDWKIHLMGVREVECAPEITVQEEPFRLAAIWRDPEGRVRGGVTVNWPRESVRLRTALAGEGAA